MNNTVVPIKVGNLMIPITDKKYELFSNLDINLSRRDFENFQGKWKGTFDKLYKNRINKYDFYLLFFYLGKILYEKIKIEHRYEFKKSDLINVCNIIIIKDIIKKGEVTLHISLDCLKEFKKKKTKKTKKGN